MGCTIGCLHLCCSSLIVIKVKLLYVFEGGGHCDCPIVPGLRGMAMSESTFDSRLRGSGRL